jgi:WD40 repeat protein/tRNA A-37 threonylcarbamoyl transferase component Bud32
MERDELCGRTLGEFVLRDRIGEGGFGAVYRCEQPLLGREAVIKVLQHRLRTDDNVVQRFTREARLASRLDHPYAAHVYAFGVEKTDGLCWIAMELVRGTTLDRWLRQRGPLPVAELVPFFERIAEVVHTAHEHGIVHRDLKPSNVMVVERAGRLLPKLLDFGIAKLVDERTYTDDSGSRKPVAPDAANNEQPHQLTNESAVIGSPPYMAPEQWDSAPTVSPAADLYALGIVAFEALSGRRPFESETSAGHAELHRRGKIPSLGEAFAPELDGFFARALAKRPEDRPSTALVLAAELRVASGLAVVSADLPRLDEGVRDAWIAEAPQPLAEAVAALDGARNVHQARDAARDLARGVLRYALALALCARARVRPDDDEPALDAVLRALRRRDLDDDERARLLRMLVDPFAAQRGAYPLPELVDFGLRDDLVFPAAESSAHEHGVRAYLAGLIPALAALLRAASFVLEYRLVVPRDGRGELWTGLRRQRRMLAVVRGKLDDAGALLIDRGGRPALVVAPLLQIIPPAIGVDPELFVFDGRGRNGARFVAAPAGYVHHDPEVWDWLAANVFGERDAEHDTGEDDRPPYLGLAAFTAADADRFVGREREIDAFANQLRRRSLQIVVGASGAGKSSFVHAGVVPALPSSWRTVVLRPGTAPIAALASRIAAAGFEIPELRALLDSDPTSAVAAVICRAPDGVVVIVDQLEELFTCCTDQNERERFAATLAAFAGSADEPSRVICTVRDDFLMNVEALPSLRALVPPALFLLGNPARHDLVRTIVEPARRVGYELSDPKLADEMADAVADRPGALALLSFAAARLWELRDRTYRRLTREAYDAVGGIGGALGRHAEETFRGLTGDQARITRDVFRHLVTVGGTRQQLTRAELCERVAHADAVVDRLVAARLLASIDTDGGAAVEIVHETLIAAWPRLDGWVRENLDDARMRDQLRTAAKQWIERERGRGLLWREDALAELERWRHRSDVVLTESERDFADASRAAARRGRRVRRGLLAITFLALAATALVMARLRGVAADQSALATARAGEINQRLVDSYLEQARTKLQIGRRWEALASLVAAQKLGAASPVIDTMRAIARAPARAMEYRIAANVGRTWSVRYSRDGRWLATAGEGGAALWDARSGRLHARLDGHEGAVRDAVFDPAGLHVATIGFDGTLRVFDADGRLQQLIRAHTSIVRCVAWRPDGRWLATGGDDGVIAIWDPTTGRQQFAFTVEPHSSVGTCEFGARVVVAGTIDGQIITVDPESRSAAPLGHHDDWTRSIAFDPTGEHVLTASLDHTVRIWDLASHRELTRLAGASDGLNTAAFSPDGTRVVGVGRDSMVRVWDSGGTLRLALAGHTGVTWDAEFSHDGRRILTSADDGSARIWDAETGMPLAVLEGHGAAVLRARFSPDDAQVVTSSYDGTVVAWRPQPTFVIDHVDGVGAECAIGGSADGLWVTVACADHVDVWDIRAHRRLARLHGGERAAATAARTLIAEQTHVELIDPNTARVIAKLELDHSAASASALGDRFGIVDGTGMVRIMGGDGGVIVQTHQPQPWTDVAVLPDDHWVALASGTLALFADARMIWSHVVEPSDQNFGAIASDRFCAIVGLKELWLYERGTDLLVPLAGHQATTTDAAFDRASQRVVSTSQDGTAIIWDLATRHRVHQLVSRAQYLATAAFDASDRLIVALDGAGNVQLFDADAGTFVAAIDGRSPRPVLVRRAADGAFVAFDHVGGVVVWRVVPDRDPIAAAEHDLACLAPTTETVGTCTP